MTETAPAQGDRYPIWIALALLTTVTLVVLPVTIGGGWVAGEMYDTSAGRDPETDGLVSAGFKLSGTVLGVLISLGLIKGTYAGVDWLRSRRSSSPQ